jgi:hypothetical protein
MSDNDVARAKEKGISDALFARMRAVYRRSELDWLLNPNGPPLAALEREVDVRERTMNGPFHVREANVRDDEALSELWAHSPEKIGDWSVVVERSPNAFAQFRLHEECSLTVLEHRGSLHACTAWSRRKVLVQGKPILIHVAHSMRVHQDHRGERLADLVRRFPPRATSRPTMAQYMYVRTGNEGVLGFLNTVAKETFGNIGAAGVTTEITHLQPRHRAAAATGVRKGRPEDFAACAALINRTHGAFDLFSPYTEESLAFRLDQGIPGELPPWYPYIYGLADFYVLEQRGRIVACAGLWDRGRDMREVWRKGDETQTIEVTNLLDFGYAEGAEDAMARLIEHLLSLTAALARTSLVVPFDRFPALLAMCSGFEPRGERRTFEWTPFNQTLPRSIPEPYTDLRFW